MYYEGLIMIIDWVKRIGFDFTLLIAGVVLLAIGAYLDTSAPLQLLLFKAVTVSAGILHAHAAGKMLFPKVDWTDTLTTSGEYVRIAFYMVIPLVYAFGG